MHVHKTAGCVISLHNNMLKQLFVSVFAALSGIVLQERSLVTGGVQITNCSCKYEGKSSDTDHRLTGIRGKLDGLSTLSATTRGSVSNLRISK